MESLFFGCAVASSAELMEPGDLLAFHGLGRFLEADQSGLVQRCGEAPAADPVVGFGTCGEQLTRVAFGRGVE